MLELLNGKIEHLNGIHPIQFAKSGFLFCIQLDIFNSKKTLTGSYRHAICVFGIGDLGWLLQQNQLFGNKFDDRKDDLVLQCLEDWLNLREREEKECTDSTLF